MRGSCHMFVKPMSRPVTIASHLSVSDREVSDGIRRAERAAMPGANSAAQAVRGFGRPRELSLLLPAWGSRAGSRRRAWPRASLGGRFLNRPVTRAARYHDPRLPATPFEKRFYACSRVANAFPQRHRKLFKDRIELRSPQKKKTTHHCITLGVDTASVCPAIVTRLHRLTLDHKVTLQ